MRRSLSKIGAVQIIEHRSRICIFLPAAIEKWVIAVRSASSSGLTNMELAPRHWAHPHFNVERCRPGRQQRMEIRHMRSNDRINCLHPECGAIALYRGLCIRHYRQLQYLIRQGKQTWEGAEKAKLCQPFTRGQNGILKSDR
jgi:hypothetical protein